MATRPIQTIANDFSELLEYFKGRGVVPRNPRVPPNWKSRRESIGLRTVPKLKPEDATRLRIVMLSDNEVVMNEMERRRESEPLDSSSVP